MKRTLLLAALAVGLGAMALTRGAPPTIAPLPPRSAPAPSARPSPAAPLSRNPFEFPPRAPQRTGMAMPSEPARQVALVAPPPSPVRLVGFVHQGERLRVVLVVEGETVLLEVGEAALGYALLSADEGDGARLKAPDGSEVFIRVAE